MKILIQTIPHSCQRYDTIGDWQFITTGKFPGLTPEPGLAVHLSEMSDERYEFLVALHEMVEAYLCKHAGISSKEVDAWDMLYQGEGEPGDALGCPYNRQHRVASAIEELVALHLDIDWKAYEKEVEDLCQTTPKS